MEKFDIYIIKETVNNPLLDLTNRHQLQDLWWKEKGFIGLNLELEEAKKIKNQLISKQMITKISPVSYREKKNILYEEAKKIAKKELNALKLENKEYGELKEGIDSPIWFAFLADDYELQKQGYVPGYWGCYIDKLNGNIISKDIIMKYEFL